jgi:hypothetical protein
MVSFNPRKEIGMKRTHYLASLALGFVLAIPSTGFGQGTVMITSPADGATLDAMDDIRLAYKVNPGPRGDHSHLYIDNKEVAILRERKGSYLLETLSSGNRSLCVKIVNKAHVPIGIGQCIQVTVK